jgi:hypothetical protein
MKSLLILLLAFCTFNLAYAEEDYDDYSSDVEVSSDYDDSEELDAEESYEQDETE